MDAPVTFYQEEVQKLNQEGRKRKQDEKVRQISSGFPRKIPDHYALRLSSSPPCFVIDSKHVLEYTFHKATVYFVFV